MTVEYRQIAEWPKFRIGNDGTVIGARGRPLRLFTDGRGYLRVNYYHKGKWTQLGVHVLVCTAFHGPKPEWADLVAHRDGNPGNAQPSNLRWATYLDNEADKRRHKRHLAGARNHRAVLTETQVLEIRQRRGNGEKLLSLAIEFGVTITTISCIYRRKSWTEI